MSFSVETYVAAKKYAEKLAYGSITPSQSQEYDDIKNAPIKKLTGNLSSPIILSQLSPAIYQITGNYKIEENSTETYIDANSNNLYLVSESDIVKLSANGLLQYRQNENGTYEKITIPNLSDIEKIVDDLSKAIPRKVSDLENDLKFATTNDVKNEVTKQLNEQIKGIDNDSIDALF